MAAILISIAVTGCSGNNSDESVKTTSDSFFNHVSSASSEDSVIVSESSDITSSAIKESFDTASDSVSETESSSEASDESTEASESEISRISQESSAVNDLVNAAQKKYESLQSEYNMLIAARTDEYQLSPYWIIDLDNDGHLEMFIGGTDY